MGPRRPAFFDPDWYLEINPDVELAKMDPCVHYMLHGRFEGRMPCALIAAARERDIQFGCPGASEDSLVQLSESPVRAENVWARVALARRRLDQGQVAEAHSLLTSLRPKDDLAAGFGLLDPVLVALEAATRAGDHLRAWRLLFAGRHFFGGQSDLHLAGANLLAERFGTGRLWQRWIAALYRKHGLGAIAVGSGSSHPGESTHPFDRLRPAHPVRSHAGGPLTSVIVPARNAASTIGTALRGLSEQSWRELEILVVDNGSTDQTAQIVRQHMAGDSRIRLIDGSAEPGAYAARNLGMAHAQGEFLTVHDADDWSHPDRIALQVRELQHRPSLRACIAHWVNTTPSLRFTRWWKNDGLVHQNLSSLMIRRSTFKELGYWDRVRVGADSEYYNRIVAAFGIDAIGQLLPALPLTFGRRTDTSLSETDGLRLGTLRCGPRRDYWLSMGDWHKTAQQPHDLYLPLHPDQRPFPAPGVMTVRDKQAESTLRESGLFDAEWMLLNYPDLRHAGADPLDHYLKFGVDEGRDPGPNFSSSGYLADNACEDVTPLEHAWERNLEAYLPDLAGSLPAPPPAPKVIFVGHQVRDQVYGAERAFLDLLDRAREWGVTPIVVLPQAMNRDYIQDVRDRCHFLHIRPMGWRYGRLKPSARTVSHLVDLIRRWESAEVHQNTVVLDAPLAAARIVGIPAIVHVHELPDSDPQLCHDLGATADELREDLLANADRFICVSAAVQKWIGAPDRSTLLPNRIDPALFELPFEPDAPPRIALVGSLSTKKGVIEALEIAQRFSEGGGQGRFVLIGPDSQWSGRILPANVTLEGYCPTPLMAMTKADIVLSISRVAESFGRTVFEAMAAGRPVLCWERGAPPDLVGRDSGAGRVVPADDVSAAVAALIEMTSNLDKLRSRSRAARNRARDLYHEGETIDSRFVFPCLRNVTGSDVDQENG